MIDLFKFLFTHIVGTLILVLVGACIIGMDILGFVSEFSREAETAPTSLAVAEFEKTGKVPTQRWLELTDGQLIWAEKVDIVVTREDKKGKKIGDGTVRTTFVPLVSKGLIESWKNGPARDFPLHQIRIYVRYEPNAWEKLVLKEEGNPDIRAKLSGMVVTLDKEEKLVRDGLYSKGDRVDPKKVLIVRYGQTAPSTGVVICVGVFFLLVGLLFMVPFGLRIMRGAK